MREIIPHKRQQTSISQAEQKFQDPRCLKREIKLSEAIVQMVKVVENTWTLRASCAHRRSRKSIRV